MQKLQVLGLLGQLQTFLDDHKLATQKPSVKALSSKEPFAVDTLSPTQWLRWIFIPKFLELLKENKPLPQGFKISPYFEESLKNENYLSDLLVIIFKIEQILKK